MQNRRPAQAQISGHVAARRNVQHRQCNRPIGASGHVLKGQMKHPLRYLLLLHRPPFGQDFVEPHTSEPGVSSLQACHCSSHHDEPPSNLLPTRTASIRRSNETKRATEAGLSRIPNGDQPTDLSINIRWKPRPKARMAAPATVASEAKTGTPFSPLSLSTLRCRRLLACCK